MNIDSIKGQLMSKGNYLDLDSSKKRTKYLTNSALATKFQVHFFEELRKGKFAFEII